MREDPLDEIPLLPATHIYPADDEPFRDQGEEDLFRQALPLFERPPDPTASNRVLLISLVCYVAAHALTGPRGFDIHWLASLIGVILLHEVGHYLGMVLFGYRNVQIFFVPFFGGAAAGRKHAAPVWQEVIVLLLGPLPGIALAGGLYAVSRPDPDPNVREAIYLLVWINAFNLLPLVPFDGGKVVNLLLFSRWAFLEAVFQLAAVAGLVFLGWYLESWMLYVIAGLVFLSVPHQHRLRREAIRFRKSQPELPRDLEALTRAEQRELFLRIRKSAPRLGDAKLIASNMRSLHEMTVTAAPGFFTMLLFLAIQVAGFVAAGAILLWMVFDRPPPPPAPAPQAQEAAQFMLLEAKALNKATEASRLRKKAREDPEQAEALRQEARRLDEEARQLKAQARDLLRDPGKAQGPRPVRDDGHVP